MHQSGRSETMASIRDLPQPGSQRTESISLSVRPAQVVAVDPDEPLLGGAEDHRLLATPAVGIAMNKREFVIEITPLAEQGDDLRVRLEHPFAHQPGRSLVVEPSRAIDGAQGGELIGAAGLIVLGAVPGCGVDQPRAVFDRDVLSQDDRAGPLEERVVILGVFEVLPPAPPEFLDLGQAA